MSPNVAGLRVNAEYGLEARIEGVEWGSVALDQEVVVPQPLGEMLMMYDGPASQPHTSGDLLGLVERPTGHGHEVKLTVEHSIDVVIFLFCYCTGPTLKGTGCVIKEDGHRPDMGSNTLKCI